MKTKCSSSAYLVSTEERHQEIAGTTNVRFDPPFFTFTYEED